MPDHDDHVPVLTLDESIRDMVLVQSSFAIDAIP